VIDSELTRAVVSAGAYSVYVIARGKREVTEHRGNLTEYFAKTVLTVK
jgi:hypothetical protein